MHLHYTCVRMTNVLQHGAHGGTGAHTAHEQPVTLITKTTYGTCHQECPLCLRVQCLESLWRHFCQKRTNTVFYSVTGRT